MLAVVMIGAPIAIWLLVRILFAPPKPSRARPVALAAAPEPAMFSEQQLEAFPTLVADLPGLVLRQFEQTLDEIQTLPEIQREELLS